MNMSKKFSRKQIEAAIRLYESILNEFTHNEADITEFKDRILDIMRKHVNIIMTQMKDDMLIVRYKTDGTLFEAKFLAYDQITNTRLGDEEHDTILKVKNFDVIPAKNNNPYEEKLEQIGEDYDFNVDDKDFEKRILEAIGIL